MKIIRAWGGKLELLDSVENVEDIVRVEDGVVRFPNGERIDADVGNTSGIAPGTEVELPDVNVPEATDVPVPSEKQKKRSGLKTAS